MNFVISEKKCDKITIISICGGNKMDIETLKKNFEDHKFHTSFFETKEEAAAYLKEKIHGEQVGFGGSVTLQEMGLYDILKEDNDMAWHWRDDMPAAEARKKAMSSTVYILSANGVAETGELVNIDGTGNRVAASLFGPKRVFYIVGKNKIAPDLSGALKRAKNIACTRNAVRLGVATPCRASADDHCYNCSSPARICNATVILERPMNGMETEIVFINEELGY